MNHRMLDHITDGPSDPEDAQDPDFAEYQEPEFIPHDRQAHADEGRRLKLDIEAEIERIRSGKHFTLRHDYLTLLCRARNWITDSR